MVTVYTDDAVSPFVPVMWVGAPRFMAVQINRRLLTCCKTIIRLILFWCWMFRFIFEVYIFSVLKERFLITSWNVSPRLDRKVEIFHHSSIMFTLNYTKRIPNKSIFLHQFNSHHKKYVLSIVTMCHGYNDGGVISWWNRNWWCNGA